MTELAPEPVDQAPAADADSARAARPHPHSVAPEVTDARTPRASPRRRVARGAALAFCGSFVTLLVMATDTHFAWSVPIGLLGCLVAIFGVLDGLGTFDDDRAPVATTSLRALFPLLSESALAAAAWVTVLRLAVAGVLPFQLVSAAVLVTAGFLWLVTCFYRLAKAIGVFREEPDGKERGLFERHGFWLVALNALIYLPMLGSFSLIDPWETHYGEVAREMLVRDDWISLWWAQDGWFWSKPILDFWLQGLSFSLLGVRFAPDAMIEGVASGRLPQPEWAARLPIFLLTVVGVYLLYKGVAKAFGRRPAFLGGLALTTMPYWYFLARQSMTDMPYVAPLAGAMGLVLLGLHTDAEERAGLYEIRVGSRALRFSAFHVVFGLVLLCVLPQVLYLASRNLSLQIAGGPFGFRPHLDEFFAGSGGGNCGLPGNQACRQAAPALPALLPATAGLAGILNPVLRILGQPAALAALWATVAALLLWLKRSERRLASLSFVGAVLLLVVSAAAKGAPGLVIPIATIGAYLVACRRIRDLARLEIAVLVLLIACVVLPWYVQMYLRHGQPFIDRLIHHDMYKRAFVHVHDTNTGDDTSFRYYIWQLGYGIFPWTGLGAAGLLWWARRGEERLTPRTETYAFLGLWFVVAFSMFTISLTKFHHYVFPAVPPIAMLLGVVLDKLCPSELLPRGRRLFVYALLVLTATAFAVYGTTLLVPGGLLGTTHKGIAPDPMPALGAALLAAALGLLAGALLAARRHQRPEQPDHDGTARHEFHAAMLAAIGIAAAIAIGLTGRDLVVDDPGSVNGQARLLHLFTYNYRRPWPESLDFRGVLLAFTIVGAVGSALLANRRVRPHAAGALIALSLLWAAWGTNAYFVRTAPHWGQRETIARYYEHRKSAGEPIVAYQMNWKGENFYTGNRVPAFVSSGEKFKQWLRDEQAKGVKVFYFTTEHSRVGSLKGELGKPKQFELLTDKTLNNKFVLARAEF